MSNAAFRHPVLPYYGLGAGIKTQLGTLVPTGSEIVAYVRGTAGVKTIADGDHPSIIDRLYGTLNEALGLCRSGRGDVVVVLPGHTENVSSADQMSSLVAGTTILGLGYGTMRPTFTWTAATATWLLDVANVMISNCIMAMAGPSGSTALTVTAPMTISAAGCALIGCEFECEKDADQGATIAVTTTAAADDLSIVGCKFYGSSNGTLPTTYLRLVGADRLKLYDSDFFGATSSATVGVVQMVTTASTNVDIRGNSFTNLATGAVHAVTGLATSTGHMDDNVFEPALSLPTAEQLGLPPGAKAFFVDASGGSSVVNFAGVAYDFSTTVDAALAKCRASKGDAVVVMPGHTENVASADAWASWLAGTRVIGLGHGTLRPTFTWTTAASTVLLNVANATIENCILKCAGPNSGALTVTAPITISAAGCALIDCDIQCEIDADEGATIAVTTTAAADDLSILRCKFYGSSNGTLVTTYLRLVGADRLRMYDCDFYGATSSATVGVVQMATTASTNIDIRRCNFSNLATAAIHATTGLGGSTGHMSGCIFEPELTLPSAEQLGLGTGARLFFCDSGGTAELVNFSGIAYSFSTTLNAALAKCAAGPVGAGAVVCLPGHEENVSTADQMSSLASGVRVIGLGHGTLRPKFTWTATGATWLLDQVNTTIENCVLILATTATGGATIAAPITVSAAGCKITGCQIRIDGDADDLVTIGVTTTAGATDFEFSDNDVYGATAAECTTFLQLVGAVRAKILRNSIVVATSAVGVGPIRFLTTDSTNVLMLDNRIRNNKAASTACVTVGAGATSSSGWVDRLFMTALADGANQLVLGNADGAWSASVASFTFGRFINVANLAGERAAEVTVVSA